VVEIFPALELDQSIEHNAGRSAVLQSPWTRAKAQSMAKHHGTTKTKNPPLGGFVFS